VSAPEIEVVESPARACAAVMIGAVTSGAGIVLAGGSTPRAAYQEFVAAVGTVGVDLADTTWWFGDERCVPPDDERSNYGMVKESMLEPLGDAAAGLHVLRMKGELGFSDAADDYERELRAAGPSAFELVLLGIGPDGHTASMFPDQASLAERSRLVVGVPTAGLEPFVPRVTMTFAALSLARHVVVLASGSSKADAVARAFGPAARPDPHVPSSMLASSVERLTVLLDAAAAEKL
jgi:6-phosphogluconolactonase